ncbi:MAG: hypothetical protein VX304_02110 [Planctomycetota bacterium]|nr:hypothetical protein [Planctomycetota bacterium]
MTTTVPAARAHQGPVQRPPVGGLLGAIASVVRCSTLPVWLVIVVVLSAWPGRSQGAAPTLTRLYPAGGQRGTTVKVECTGKFKWPVKIWAPGVKVVALKDSGQIQVTIPADLAADRVWIRLYDAEGASPALPFLLSNLVEFR